MSVQPPAPPPPPPKDGDQRTYLDKVVNNTYLSDEQKVNELKKWIKEE